MAGGPERPAVSAPDGRATYAELDRLATGVARLVLEAAAPADVPVLIDLEAGLLLVAAQLGVWRAGRFFVALYSTAPPERNATIVADAGAVLALVGRNRGLRRSRGCASEVVLDRGRIEAAARGTALPEAEPGLAALTYTSGSTGRPKGVVQTHASVLRNVALTRAALGLGPGDRVPWLYPPSVNPAMRELLTALFSGAEVLPYKVTTEGVAGLGGWLRRTGATVYSSGVTLFRQLAASTPPGATFPAVRRVKLGGESVTRAEIELFRRLFAPPARLYFGLGTTETGTVTTCFFDHDAPLPAGVPLGRPAPDLELAVLDEDGRELATGEIGELAITGAGLAAGYWRDPELTARAFVSQPERPGVVCYRTGDRVRRRPDGELEHHGRRGSQVKIRGLRMELAEVESVLAALPGVAAAAVRVELGDGDARLAAFVVPALRAGDLDRAELRRGLAERLPLAMVPDRFLVVPSLPSTPNGKLDRRALAGLAGRELPAERRLVYPRDPIETRLAALWCEVLGLELVGIDEPFFDLGGDSSRAVELFRQIEERFGEALPVALVFEAPTVRLQAERLRDGLARAALTPIVRLGRADAQTPPLFCVPAVDGYAFVYRPLAAELAEDWNVEVLQFPGLDGTTEPLGSVEELAAELIRRMRVRQAVGPFSLLGHSFGGLVAYEMARQLTASGERVTFLGLVDSHTPDADRWLARAVRDLELLTLGTARVWREAGRQGFERLVTTARTLAHMAFRGYRRRLGGSLVAHTIHHVRQVSSAARRHYRFGPPWDSSGTRTVLFRATPPPGTPRHWTRLVDRSNGWSRHFATLLEVRAVPGDHIQMLNPPHVATLAGELRALLPPRVAPSPARPGRDKPGRYP